jgi:hypothetical protein
MKNRLLGMVAALTLGGACGGGTAGDGDDGWTVYRGMQAVMFGQVDRTIYRFDDASGDGDYNDAGERAVFVQDSDEFFKPMIAIDGNTIIGIVNSPINPTGALRWLQDLDGDGSALGPGESRIWWAGALPTGGVVRRLENLARASDGTVLVVTQGGGLEPQAIYLLRDANGNGDANDPDEVMLVATLPTGVSANSIARDRNGDVWFVGNPGDGTSNPGGDLYRVRAGTVAEVFDRATLAAQAGVVIISHKIDALPDGSIIFSGAVSGASPVQGEIMIALRDGNDDHEIAIDEVDTIWSYADGEYYCSFADLHVLEDGSILGLGNGGMTYRLVDGTLSGDFFDVGEIFVSYDPVFASANGGSSTQMTRLSASTK